MSAQQNHESGSIFVMILVAIAMFAAISFAVLQGSRGGLSNLSKEQARMGAQEIIAYANTVQKSISKLRLKGCMENQISFERSNPDNYTNTNAPTDNSCHVFNLVGGAINAQTPSPLWLENSFAGTETYYGQWVFSGRNNIEGVASSITQPALISFLPFLSAEICIEINQILGISAQANGLPPDEMGVDLLPFQGTYAFQTSIGDDPGGEALAGKSMGCFRDSNSSWGWANGNYVFYAMLINR